MTTKAETKMADANMTADANRTKWVLDPPHSEISFKVKHLMITNVKGEFREFQASIYSKGEMMTADVEVRINAESISTRDAKRDAHLRSADFLDVENHKEIVFTGKNFSKTGEEKYILNGDLEIRGIKKPVTLDVEFNGLMKDPWGKEKAGFTVEGKINRKDWGLNWNAALEAGGVLVGDEVKIYADIQCVRAEG